MTKKPAHRLTAATSRGRQKQEGCGVAQQAAVIRSYLERLVVGIGASVLFVAACARVSAAEPIGYVVSESNNWKVVKSEDVNAPSLPLKTFQLLDSSDRIFASSKDSPDSASIEIRFFPAMCLKVKTCGPTEPCSKPLLLKTLFEELSDRCRETKESWSGAILSSMKTLFQSESGNKLLMAVTLSRGTSDPSQESRNGILREAVLTVEDGNVDINPLFRTRPANSAKVFLQFCTLNSALEEDCEARQNSEHFAVVFQNDQIAQLRFARSAGLYLVRLWSLTARGEQLANQTAVVLVGPRVSFEVEQRTFDDIYQHTTAGGVNDPVLRAAFANWLVQASKAISR